MSNVRVVRPRPLGLTDRIPVYWPGQEPSQELKQIDGGALYRHLEAASSPAVNRKRKRPERYHAPKEGEAHEHFSPLRRAAEQQGQSSGPIAVPRVRTVEDYHVNQQAAAHHGPFIEGPVAAAPYLRHKHVLPGMYEEHQPTEYDVDDDDIAWLGKMNAKNGQGLFAAAVGLYRQVSQRISGGGEPSTPNAAGQRLSVDDFERAVDLLELAHFDAVRAWWEEQQSGPSTSAPQIPKIPPMRSLLPRVAALDTVTTVIQDSKLAALLVDYWLRKRQQQGGPLLPRLWFEQPWKLVAFAHFIENDDEDFDEHLPFMAIEPRSAHAQRRPAGNRRRINEEDAVTALFNLRSELEMLRTLADQVRKREKLKRQLLLVSQQEMQMRHELGLPASAPIPKTARLHQLARTQSVAAGGASAAKPVATKSVPESAMATAAATVGRSGTAAAGRFRSAAKAGPSGRKGIIAAAAAAAAAATIETANHAVLTDVDRLVAKAAAAAAAVASPHDGECPRQTRTAAAAAAAAFELAFAAKRAKVEAQVDVDAAEGLVGELKLDTAATSQPVPDTGQQQKASKRPESSKAHRAAAEDNSKRKTKRRGKAAGSKQPTGQARAQADSAGDADDEREDSAGAHPHLDEVVQPTKRRRRNQVQHQGEMKEQQHPSRHPQQGKLSMPDCKPKQKRQQPAATGIVAARQVEGYIAPSSTSSDSDDSDDADYTVSEQEDEGHIWLQRNSRSRSLHQDKLRIRAGKAAAGDDGVSDASSSDHEAFLQDSDDGFQPLSKRALAIRLARQQQQQEPMQRHRHGKPLQPPPAAAEMPAANTPRRPVARIAQQEVAQQAHKQCNVDKHLLQGHKLAVRKARDDSEHRPAVDIEGSPAASSSGHETEIDCTAPAEQQLRHQQRQSRNRKGTGVHDSSKRAVSGQTVHTRVNRSKHKVAMPQVKPNSTLTHDKKVLRPHNRQHQAPAKASHAGCLASWGQADISKQTIDQPICAAPTAPAPAKASQPLACRTRLVHRKKHVGGKSADAAAQAGQQHRPKRAGIGGAELRSLGILSDSHKQPAALSSRSRR